MNWKKEYKILLWMLGAFFLAFFLPVGVKRFDNAVMESLELVKWYAREHVVFCLIPAFYIAGAIGVFISQASVMKYLGAKAKKSIAYGVASISGTILAVCSCTVLPLFAGIYKMGAGLGPATSFLYSGPAINVLAIALTARLLGVKIGIARAVGAISFSIVIGLLMALIFRKEEKKRVTMNMAMPEVEPKKTLLQNAVYFFFMVGILVFANFGKAQSQTGLWHNIYSIKWIITTIFSIGLGAVLIMWFEFKIWKVLLIVISVIIATIVSKGNHMIIFAVGMIVFSYFVSTQKGEMEDWFSSSWVFAKQIFPLLFGGVVVAGLLLGRPGGEGIIPSQWIYKAVGGNSLSSNLFASVAGAFMYFATLTEVPILLGLMNNGMGNGPALALLLAGPALSLPNMLVIRNIMGTKKTVVFVSLVVIMSTVTGMIYGNFIG